MLPPAVIRGTIKMPIDFTLTPEQRQLQLTSRRFCDQYFCRQRVWLAGGGCLLFAGDERKSAQ
jgi:hypothetical protein